MALNIIKKNILIFCLLLIIFPLKSISSDFHKGPVPGRFVVKLTGKADITSMKLSLESGQKLDKISGIEFKSDIEGGENWHKFYAFSSRDMPLTADDVKSILGEGNIESIEPDYYLEFFEWPQDSLFDKQWYLYNNGQLYIGIERVDGDFNDYKVNCSGTPGVDIQVHPFYESAPSETTRVVVAIVDSGIDTIHPELADHLWQNPDEIPGNGLDDDHNGFIDDFNGYDISGDEENIIEVVGDSDPTDYNGHGTHLAGIVAAKADSHGVVGIAPWAEIMAVKITPNNFASVGAAGIMYAVNAGARVINISWGSPFESGVLKEAIRVARLNGVFVSIAPGNSGNAERYYPAAFDSTFVVAAGNSDGYVTYFSTYGSHIDLVAPGQDILSLRADGTDMYSDNNEPEVRIVGEDSLYYLADGTSMSAPMVAGAAALLLSYRPDLNLEQLENILIAGADDIVDPFNQGDELVGYDTLSGHGYLNIESSMALITEGGLYFVEPIRGNRYIDDLDIKVAPIMDYTGSWELAYTLNMDHDDWQVLASGDELPADSIIYSFTNGPIEGEINLRLIDKYGKEQTTRFIYVRQRKIDISSPLSGEELKYNIRLYGSAYGPDFDSMSVYSQKSGNEKIMRFSSTGEFYDSLIYIWSASGNDTGNFDFYLYGYFGMDELTDTISVSIASSFTDGWPQKISNRGAMTPACTDLNKDGLRELVVPTSSGLYLFEADGTITSGYPVMPQMDMRCVPAIYDVDHDGKDEIICTNDSGLYVFNHDGTITDGWPQYCYTGSIPYEYGYPNPSVIEISYWDLINGKYQLVIDSAISIINKAGYILAYNFEGRSFFASLGGLFSYFDVRAADFYSLGGETSPMVTSVDLDGDEASEVIASYTAPYPYAGLGVFQSKNGQPAYDDTDPVVVNIASVYGTAIADLDDNDTPEIITAGHDVTGMPYLWVVTDGNQLYPGFPVAIPGAMDWIPSYPIIADLDLDGIPEILMTFFEFDISSLYIFKADGTPYISNEEQPSGEALVQPVTFGTPTVADITGDEYPEIIIRSGYIIPGTGTEKLYVLDYQAQILPGWPISTPSRVGSVFSSRFAPLVDDLDGDDKVEVVLIGDDFNVLVWDFDASYDNGKNKARFLYDNLNTGYYMNKNLPTDVKDEIVILPELFNLYQNYPNPFNPQTVITFDLSVRSDVVLEVYNILGQLVTTLVDANLSAGKHKETFDGSSYSSGIYLYRLRTEGDEVSKKMVLVK